MSTTLDLLEVARKRRGMNLSDYSRFLGYKRNTLNVCNSRGKLSPRIAATIATDLGEPWQIWAAKAAMENRR